METVFLHLLNMSITAGWIALAVIILRLLLKKAPKWITVLLWGLVGLRLIFPFSTESVLSLIPSAETVPPEIIYAQEPQIHTGVEFFNSSVNPVISESLAPQAGASVNPVQIILFVATIIWLAGVAGMLIYTLVSYLRLKSKVKISMPIDKNIYICDSINTPFILGVIKPKIYLPSTLSSTEQEYVLSHEKAHLKRRDHLIKPLGFLLLSVYWFNPLLWVAYVLLCRDIETACDEKVIKDMELQQKKEYSTALLNCSVPRRMIAACPLAFGEVSVKQRIKTVLNYKKPAFWITIVAIILCIALSVGFLTNPVENNPYGVKVVDSGSDIEGVSLEFLELEIAEDSEQNPYIEVKWKNKNSESYTCGEEFYVYKYVNGEWVNIRRGDYAFVSIGYIIPEKGSFKHSYDLWNIEIDEVGTYRFESTFLKNKGDTFPTEYKAWIDFEVTKVPDFEENGYKTTNSGSDREGISAQIVDLNLTAAKPYIEVMWKNDNDHDFTCGEQFYIYKLENGEWINCRSGEYAWEDIGYIVPAKGTFTHKYSLYNINIDTAGTYRFESPFSSKGEKVWLDFQYPYTGASSSQGTNESFEAKDVTHYYCNNTTDVMRPQITLYRRTRDFKFTLSSLSSYVPTGKYSTEGNVLTLTADDGNKYVFEVLDAENLKFIADKSADIPKYKYSPNEEAKQPFTDGDIFELEPKESTNIVQGQNLYLDFEALEDTKLYFSSGAGAWYSSIHLNKDGSFVGEHRDADQGASTEEYPNGTIYKCEYSGKFSNLQKINDYTYALTLETLSYEGTRGDTYIDNGVKHVTSYPYGLTDNQESSHIASDEFLLFLPSTPTNTVPGELLNWWPFRSSNEKPDTLSLYCIYNVSTKQAFFTKPLLEE
ncbi:MAG: hypothetical protein IJD93_00540 [Ruminococcus sp.]|nr:hypothetical protein [Ruminococcus sp.]